MKRNISKKKTNEETDVFAVLRILATLAGVLCIFLFWQYQYAPTIGMALLTLQMAFPNKYDSSALRGLRWLFFAVGVALTAVTYASAVPDGLGYGGSLGMAFGLFTFIARFFVAGWYGIIYVILVIIVAVLSGKRWGHEKVVRGKKGVKAGGRTKSKSSARRRVDDYDDGL